MLIVAYYPFDCHPEGVERLRDLAFRLMKGWSSFAEFTLSEAKVLRMTIGSCFAGVTRSIFFARGMTISLDVKSKTLYYIS